MSSLGGVCNACKRAASDSMYIESWIFEFELKIWIFEFEFEYISRELHAGSLRHSGSAQIHSAQRCCQILSWCVWIYVPQVRGWMDRSQLEDGWTEIN